jgi:hypothetical protein
MGQGHGQASAAGADVRDRGRGHAIRNELERGFDNQLGFGPGDEHRRRDLEGEIPELLAAGDVRDRLAPRPAGDERVIVAGEAWRRRVARGGEVLGGIPAEQPLCQQPRVEARFGVLDARVAQPRPRPVDERMDGVQETAVASFSFSDW